MARVKVEFEIEMPVLPDNRFTTMRHVEEWLRFSFGDNAVIEGDNPFIDKETPEPIFGTFKWEWA